MPDLSFAIEGAEPLKFAAVPTMAFALAVKNDELGETVHNVLLTVQIQIEAPRRRYDEAEKGRLFDLFGEPERWGDTLRPLLWTHASGVVPSFTGECWFDLHVPCSFDFNVAATKYFDALTEGDIPLLFLFSGTVFHAATDGALQAARIAWSKEARFRLPAATWRRLIEHYYPNTVWLALHKQVFEKLSAFKASRGLTSLDQALEKALDEAEARSSRELTTQ